MSVGSLTVRPKSRQHRSHIAYFLLAISTSLAISAFRSLRLFLKQSALQLHPYQRVQKACKVRFYHDGRIYHQVSKSIF